MIIELDSRDATIILSAIGTSIHALDNYHVWHQRKPILNVCQSLEILY